MSIKVRFTEEDWQRLARDWGAFWAGELERPMVMTTSYEPGDPSLPAAPSFTTNLPFEMPAEEVVARYGAQFEQIRFHGDAWPRWWPNFGPGVIAGFLGSPVETGEDTVWFHPHEEKDVSKLKLTVDPENRWYQRIMDLVRTAGQMWGDQVQVCFTDLGGNLDIVASLRGSEQLLMDLYDAPEEVLRLAAETTGIWVKYYEAFHAVTEPTGRGTCAWAPVFSSAKTYMLQCDFSYMIGPDMFEKFVLPDLAACCDYLDHAFYHLDGKGEIPHLDHLLSLERLRGIQWIPGDGAPPAEEWLDLLKRIRDGGKLCQLFVTAEGAAKIIKALGGKGFAFQLYDALTADEAEACVESLQKLAAE